MVAAQYLRKMNFISTVYVSSSEARTLTRLSERGVSKFALIRVPLADIDRLAHENHLSFDTFCNRYLVDMGDTFGVASLHVVYSNSAFSKPPEDGKLRSLRPDYQWLTISDQLLLPMPDHPDAYPLRYSTIYTAE